MEKTKEWRFAIYFVCEIEKKELTPTMEEMRENGVEMENIWNEKQ